MKNTVLWYHKLCVTSLFDFGFISFQGLKAIHSPLTGIIDFGLVARTYGKEFSNLGGDIKLGFEVQDFVENSGGLLIFFGPF